MSAGIAIVGAACRYPDARSPEELWETVLAGRRAFRSMPEERLRLADYAPRFEGDPDSLHPVEAAVLEGYTFDRARFRVPGAAYAAADLTHWLALEVATDALEQSGLLSRGLDRARCAVVVGNTLTGEFSRSGLLRGRWPYVRRHLEEALAAEGFDAQRRSAFIETFEARYKAPFGAPDEESLSGGLSNTIAGRICNFHDLHGGGFTVDGACSSSLLAVAQACDMLASGSISAAIVGGVDLSLDPFELIGFARNGALSKTAMRVFDARADGFWPGEGCGFVVLTREDDALRADLRPRAVIRGWGMSTDGAGGLTRPSVEGQVLALERAYAKAGYGPDTVSFFEAHGTGTAVGDPVEVGAMAQARRRAGCRHPAVIGSVKGNIGHTKAAAGLAGLIKAVKALEHQVVPATAGCETINPALAAYADAAIVGLESRLWHPERALRAGVGSMGFGGINVHIALERDAPRRSMPDAADRRLMSSAQDCELFLFAADDVTGLRAQVAALVPFVGRWSRADLTDAACACAARLGDGPVRAMAVAANAKQLSERLAALLDRLASPSRPALEPAHGIGFGGVTAAPRIVFMFAGQAARVRLNGGAWHRRFPELEAIYEAAGLPADGDVTSTDIAQPAIVASSLAGLAILDRIGITADAALGHSLGELAALHWGGAFDGRTLQRLAAGRGRAMAQPGPAGAMAVITAPLERTEALLHGLDVVVACHNGRAEFVVSGRAADLHAALERAHAQGVRTHVLSVRHAFHSRLMEPATPILARLVAGEALGPLLRPVVSTITGGVLPATADLASLLARQLTAPVRFSQALEQAGAADLFIEVGPAQGLARLAAGHGVCVALDAGGDSLEGLLTAAGAGFVFGSAPHIGRLFADRFARPIDLARPQRFLANPCEAAPQHLGTAHRPPPAPKPAAPELPKDGSALTIVKSLFAGRLEIDVSRIGAHDRVLSDLHMNSISVGQVVSEAARHLGLSPPASPSNYASATVLEIADALAACAGVREEDGGQMPAGVAPWVQAFETRLAERPLSGIATEMPQAWRVFAPPGAAVANWLPTGHGTPLGVALYLPDGTVDAPELLLKAAQVATCAGDRTPVLFLLDGGAAGREAAAFARCLALEHSSLRVRVVVLPDDTSRWQGWIADELGCGDERYGEAVYDESGRRRVPVFRALHLRDAASGLVPVGPGEVVLVTGGAKGIGAECALTLALATGARLGLLGRATTHAAEVRATLARLRANGIDAHYVRADVTDPAATAEAVAEVETMLGRVVGVIHAAGVNTPTALLSLDADIMARTRQVKADGLTNVLANVGALRLLVGFGSIIARIGLAGEAHYAMANVALAETIETYAAERPDCRALTMEWSVWSGLGMGETLGVVESLARQGVTALPVAQATDVFMRLVSQPVHVSTLVVTSRFGSPPTVDLDLPTTRAGRFVDNTRVAYPGVELVAEADLDDDTDPYLADHVVRGAAVFPAVLGLEAMAQAASWLLGAAPRSFEAVRFDRPVGGAGTRLRIGALRRDDGRVETVLRCDEDGFQADHFAAIADKESWGEQIHPTSSVRPSLVLASLYGDLFFHGGRFRRVTGYRALSAGQCIATIAPDPQARWFIGRPSDGLVLGDPGARDAALHAIQATIPHRRVLPVSARRILLGTLLNDRSYTVHAREVSREADSFEFDLTICDERGSPVERWEGLVLRVLEPIAEPVVWPTPLLVPYLERRLTDILPSLNVRLALCGEASTSDDVLARLLAPGDVLRRRPDGRPEAADFVSASHAGPLTLGVAARRAVGCDIAMVNAYADSAWHDLLGDDGIALANVLVRNAKLARSAARTAVWCSREAVKKAGGVPLGLVFDHVADGLLVLRGGEFRIVVWSGGIGGALHVVVVAGDEADPAVEAAYRLAETGQPTRTRGTVPVYAWHHVVGFADTNVVGNVYFANHLQWQGRCREMFLRDHAPSVLADMAAGLALITTQCACTYLVQLQAFDNVTVEMRLQSMEGNLIDTRFDYWREAGATRELVAVGRQTIACVWTTPRTAGQPDIPPALAAALQPYTPDRDRGGEDVIPQVSPKLRSSRFVEAAGIIPQPERVA